MSDEEPKIIVDEDWKSQVERERELDAVNVDDAGAGGDEPPLPEGSFRWIVDNLGTQAMFALGVVHDPQIPEVVVNLDEAKVVIDSIAILHEKTAGQLDEEEGAHLQLMLSELQRAFDARVQQFQAQALEEGDIGPLHEG
jgi:hypothetical protein